MSSATEKPEVESPEVVNLVDSQADLIEADMVRASRTFVNNIEAEEVELYQSGAAGVKTSVISANTSLIGACKDESSVLNNSLLLSAKTDELEANNTIAGGIIAENSTISDNSKVGVLVSGQVTGEKINTFLLVARDVEGPVETKLNTQQVALAGVLAGITSGLVFLLGRTLFGKK